MKDMFYTYGFIALLFLMMLGPVEASLSVSGAILATNVTPGQHISHLIYVSIDESDPPLDLRVDLNEFGQDLYGANDNLRANLDMSPCSARPFLRIDPSSFRLEAGEMQEVVLEGDLPKDVGEGGRYALVNINSLPKNIGNLGSVAISMDVPILLTIEGTEQIKIGEITDLLMDRPASGRPQNVSVIMKNTGNCHYKAYVKASLVDGEGEILASASTPPSITSIIPPTSRLFELSLAPIPMDHGTYYVNATVELENGMIIAWRNAALDLT